ncbi:hypothetical protein G4Q83_13875 [Xanthomonas theicola]|nr:hypothetical protein G4Q83_06745 [Xanthomonas theicola]QNH23495.1 hypothetical protein G4Q83_12790 [Xanthomonas theicola]QNH23496.1 hypothetical protein G4Q83_13875 [Xanthomonas theicola]
MSLVVSGANVHDGKALDGVLGAIAVRRKDRPHRPNKHPCADAGDRGVPHLRTIERHGDIPHVLDRRKAADDKRGDPKKKARRRGARSAMAGSTAPASCSFGTRSSSAASSLSTIRTTSPMTVQAGST